MVSFAKFEEVMNHLIFVKQAPNIEIIDFIDKWHAKVETPTKKQLRWFLGRFRTQVLTENKDGKALIEVARSRAIGLLEEFLATNPDSVFLWVEIERFIFEMAIRVRRPRTFSQGDTYFCGQAGIVYLFIKENPEDFVRFGCDLITTGRAFLRQMPVAPDLPVRSFMTPPDTPATDYMILSSIRNAMDISDTLAVPPNIRDMLQNALQNTQPNLLCGMLENMGYRDVETNIANMPRHFGAHDAFDLSRLIDRFATGDTKSRQKRTSFEAEDIFQYRKQMGWINDIRLKLTQGFYIIAAIDSDILESLNGPRMEPVLRDECNLHYVTVRSMMLAIPVVQMKVHSWSRTYEGSLNAIDFMERFVGYISARP